jgi:hypothetical protein
VRSPTTARRSADDHDTTGRTADLTGPAVFLDEPTGRRLIDLSAPVAVPFSSIAHFSAADITVRRAAGKAAERTSGRTR